MAKHSPIRPIKFRSGFLKGLLVFIGIILIISAIIALVLSFVFFWEAACDTCSGSTCLAGGLVRTTDMDWSFLWLTAYFFFGVIIGPIILVGTSNMTTKKAYFKQFPYSIICPNCKTLGDRRSGTCQNCGMDLDPDGQYKNAPKPLNNLDSYNPYKSYCQNKTGNENVQDKTENGQEPNNFDDNN